MLFLINIMKYFTSKFSKKYIFLYNLNFLKPTLNISYSYSLSALRLPLQRILF